MDVKNTYHKHDDLLQFKRAGPNYTRPDRVRQMTDPPVPTPKNVSITNVMLQSRSFFFTRPDPCRANTKSGMLGCLTIG